jgi:hypothetical protein
MRRLVVITIALLCLIAPAFAQAPPPSKNALVTYYDGEPFGSCSGYNRLWWDTDSNVLWFCEGGTWLSTLTGASVSFPITVVDGSRTDTLDLDPTTDFQALIKHELPSTTRSSYFRAFDRAGAHSTRFPRAVIGTTNGTWQNEALFDEDQTLIHFSDTGVDTSWVKLEKYGIETKIHNAVSDTGAINNIIDTPTSFSQVNHYADQWGVGVNVYGSSQAQLWLDASSSVPTGTFNVGISGVVARHTVGASVADGAVAALSVNNGTTEEQDSTADLTRNGFRIFTPNGKPTCDSTTRGRIYFVVAGLESADTFEVCAKNSSDVYAWHELATIP